MRNIKKLLGFLLVLSIGLQMLIIPVAAARDPYDTNLAISIDDKNGSGIQVLADRVGAIKPGDWVCFKEMDFGKAGPESVEMETTIPEGSTIATIRIDQPDGPIIAEVPVTFSSDWGIGAISATEIKAKVTGVHDIYISGNKSSLAFRSIVFYEKKVAGESFDYKMYSPSAAFTDLEGTDCAEAVRLLHGLGIIPDEESGLYEPKKSTSRGEFAYSIYRLFVPKPSTEQETKTVETVFTDVESDYKYAEAIAYVSQNGFVNGVTATEFDPYSYITYQDALTIILRALGYREIAEAAGGYPGGYIGTANKARISISAVGYDEYLKKSQTALLLEKVIDADYIMADSVKNGELHLEKEEGILGMTQNLYFGSGSVIATEVSMINMPDSEFEHGYVSIDGVTYKTGTADVLGLLGYECDFWYEDKDGEKTLKFIVPQSSTTYFDISSTEDEIYSITNNKIEYCLNEESREEEIEIDSNVSVLYNGVALEGKISDVVDNPAAFKGVIRVVKNGNRSKTIFIEEYEDYIIESIDVHTSVMKGKGSSDEISLDADNDLVMLFDAKAKKTTANKLKVGDIVTVYRSKNTNSPKLIRAYVSDKTIQGTVTEIHDDDVYINGQSYKKSNNYSGTIEIGKRGIFNLNIYGDLVAFDLSNETEAVVGLYVDSSARDTGFEKEVEIKLVDNTGKTKIYPIAQKVTYNGKRFEKAGDILSSVTDGGKTCKGITELTADEALRFKLNAKGEVSMIDTCEELAGGSDDTMKKLTDSLTKMKYTKTSGILATNGVMKYYMENTGLVFAYYDLTNYNLKDKENFWATGTASSMMPNDSTQPEILVYSTFGSECEADVIIFRRTLGGIDWKEPLIVENIAIGIDENGCETTIITGLDGGGDKLTYTVSDATVPVERSRVLLNNAKQGDIIRLKTYNNMIVDVEYVFYWDGAKNREIAGSEEEALINKHDKNVSDKDVQLNGKFIYGTVEEKTDKYLLVKYNKDTGKKNEEYGTPIIEEVTEVVPMPNKATTFYKRADGEYCVVGGLNVTSIKLKDSVTVIIHNGNTSQVIVND